MTNTAQATSAPAPRKTSLKGDTAGFNGTENYYAASAIFKFNGEPMTFTDGVKYVAETASAYWLLDVIFSHVVSIYRSKTIPDDQKRLLVCKLTVNDETDAADFVITDGNDNELARQHIEYTDFPALEQEIWVQNGVALLPSEY